MAERRIVWDDDNLHHLLVERADRAITPEEVEEVLLDEDTAVLRARRGRDRYVGRTSAGRFLEVIALGELDVRPETAWAISEERWRAAHDR
jgi:hypothetical protein